MVPTWDQLAEAIGKLTDAFPNTIEEKSCSKELFGSLLVLKDLGMGIQKGETEKARLASSQCIMCMIIIKEYDGDLSKVRNALPPTLPSYLLNAMCVMHRKRAKMEQNNLVKLVH